MLPLNTLAVPLQSCATKTWDEWKAAEASVSVWCLWYL